MKLKHAPDHKVFVTLMKPKQKALGNAIGILLDVAALPCDQQAKAAEAADSLRDLLAALTAQPVFDGQKDLPLGD